LILCFAQDINAHVRRSTAVRAALKSLLAVKYANADHKPEGLLGPSPTRWLAMMYILVRFNEIAPHVVEVLNNVESRGEFAIPDDIFLARLRVYEKIFKPLEEFVRLLEGDYVTLSSVPYRVRVIDSLALEFGWSAEYLVEYTRCSSSITFTDPCAKHPRTKRER
jgi:hypothetical protein